MTYADYWFKGVAGWYFERCGGSGLALAMLIAATAVAAVLAYILGSLNFALIISKYRFNEDIRTNGSGNAGMTNMMRTYGKSAAIATFVGDFLKAVVAVVLGVTAFGQLGGYICGLACLVGHVYPLFFGFRGGKGIVVTAATVLCLSPLTFLALFVIFVIIVVGTRYISLGSIMCMLIYPLLLSQISGARDTRVLIAIATAVFVVYLHRENIKRLRDGKENKFYFKSSVKKSKKNNDEKEG